MTGPPENYRPAHENVRSGDSEVQATEHASQFLAKIWADMGWQPPTTIAQTREAQSGGTQTRDAQSKVGQTNVLSAEKHDKGVDVTPRKGSVEDTSRPPDQPPIPPWVAPKDVPQNPPPPPPDSKSGGKIYELRKLDHRAATHNTPDAVLRLPANFDPTKPIHLVIYNHGWGSNTQTAFYDNHLDEQMAAAPPNSVLIVPEWQRSAAANSGDQGHFEDKNVFRDMVQEIFQKTPELKGKTWKDVDSMSIIAHSAGYGPSETELNKNGIADKVTSITLLDALYDNKGFDGWIKQNAEQLEAGTKRFYNFFNDTSKYSNQLIIRMKDLLPDTPVLVDLNNGDKVIDADTLVANPVVFKFSSATVPGLGPHWSMPHLYVAPVEAAAKLLADKK